MRPRAWVAAADPGDGGRFGGSCVVTQGMGNPRGLQSGRRDRVGHVRHRDDTKRRLDAFIPRSAHCPLRGDHGTTAAHRAGGALLPAPGRLGPALALGDLAAVGPCPHGWLPLRKVRRYETRRPNTRLMGDYVLIPV